jgi:hypothetical protein
MEPELVWSRVVTLTDSRGESTFLPFADLDSNERNAVEFLACFAVLAEAPEPGEPEGDAAKLLAQYMESCAPLAEVKVSARPVWCGRLSAPGYLDCTAWEHDTNKRRLLASLRG